MKEDLKPCPFCGSKKIEVAVGVIGITMLRCDGCGATVSFYQKERKEKTIEAWNRRTDDATRLIDADKTLEQLNAMADELKEKMEDEGFVSGYFWRGAMYALESAITAIKEQPAVEERKHGHWIDCEAKDGSWVVECSVCGYSALMDGDYRYCKSDYCPHCGAKMDGDNNATD